MVRILQHLNWDVFNHNELSAEYNIDGYKVDYALLLSEVPKVLIEVKKPAVTNLRSHEQQLLEYAFRKPAPLALLTNCVQWWFYLPHLPDGGWRDRRFCVVDLLDEAPVKVRDQFVNLLAKERVSSGQAVEYANRLYERAKRQEAIQAAMPKAWNKMISELDENLVELLRKRTRSVLGGSPPGKKVTREFLSKHQSRLHVKPPKS